MKRVVKDLFVFMSYFRHSDDTPILNNELHNFACLSLIVHFKGAAMLWLLREWETLQKISAQNCKCIARTRKYILKRRISLSPSQSSTRYQIIAQIDFCLITHLIKQYPTECVCMLTGWKKNFSPRTWSFFGIFNEHKTTPC